MTDFWSSMSQFWDGSFWSGWVMTLIVINYGVILFLFLWAPRVSIPTLEDGTTGHVWANGAIREGLANLPKWWLILSTIGFISAFVYTVRYPAFGEHKGIHQWTSFEQMQEELAVTDAKKAPLLAAIKSTPVLALAQNPQAMQLGERLFDDNCAACHGYDAKGGVTVGAPDLVDNTWEFGGKVSDVVASITHGRSGVMPAWEGQLRYGQIKNVAHYVLSLSGAAHDTAAAAVGKRVFDKNCSVCHGVDGTGNQMLGAPDLADNIWKWGGSLDAIMATIEHGRQGHMPAWDKRLTPDEIHVLAAWVLSHDNTKEALAANGQ